MKVIFTFMPKAVRDIGRTPLDAVWHRICEYLRLSEYEAKVYVALIESGQARARTLSVLSGVPRTKVYSVLRKLIDMSLVVEIPEEPRKFAPTPPRAALHNYLESFQSMTENLVSVVSSLEASFRKASSEERLQREDIWIIKGRQQILRKIREILSKAKRSVELVTNEIGVVLLYKEFYKLFDELDEHSVKVRIVTSNGSNNQHVLSQLKYMCKVKQSQFQLPMIYLCVDENQFLLANLQPNSFSSRSEDDRAIFSNDSVLLELIKLLVLGDG
jgi:sugar-specific transcriptional regulator TrmB